MLICWHCGTMWCEYLPDGKCPDEAVCARAYKVKCGLDKLLGVPTPRQQRDAQARTKALEAGQAGVSP